MTTKDSPPSRVLVEFQSFVTDPVAESRRIARCFADLPVFQVYQSATRGFATFATPSTIARLREDPCIRSIEPDVPMRQCTFTVSTRAKSQIISKGVQRIGARIRSSSEPRPNGVHIFVLDTGVAVHEPDLHVVEARSFLSFESSVHDLHGHGTRVGGVIAARDNQTQIVGVAPDATLHSYKVIGKTGSGWMSDVLAGVDAVIHFRKFFPLLPVILHLSLVGSVAPDAPPTMLDRVLRHVIGNHRVVVVTAAGNDASNVAGITPARVAEAITVASFHPETDHFSAFSNYGPQVNILAPGETIPTISTGALSKPIFSSGTSFAAAHVTGACALYLARAPRATPAEVLQELLRRSDVPENPPITGVPPDTPIRSVFVPLL